MLERMPKYESYKVLDNNWLKYIPSKWNLTRLGACFCERNTKVSDKQYQALSVTKNGIKIQLASAAKTNDGDNRKLVTSGDFVINSRSDRKGSSGISSLDGSVSLINIVLTPTNIEPAFCKFLLKSYSFAEEFYRIGYGIVADLWTTRYKEMKFIPLAIPPRCVQEVIYLYLDKKVALIDEAISIKEQQIKLLKEQKQIIIQNALTKGLEPTVPMKDSGIDWIGKTPTHWEIHRLKQLAKLSPKINYRDSPADHVVFLPMEKVNTDGTIVQNLFLPIKEVKTGFSIFCKNDIILAKITPCFENGKSALLNNISTDIAYGSTEFFVLRAGHKISSYYLYLTINSSAFIKLGVALMVGSAGQKRITSSFLTNFQIALPPLKEQDHISKHLDRISLVIEKLIFCNFTQIQKLKEYKTTLIDAAVTGKIKITPEMINT